MSFIDTLPPPQFSAIKSIKEDTQEKGYYCGFWPQKKPLTCNQKQINAEISFAMNTEHINISSEGNAIIPTSSTLNTDSPHIREYAAV